MAMAAPGVANRGGGPSGLADVLDVLLDKGLVIDAFVRVSVVGIELLTIDARVVVASVDTYLRFAEAVNRLDLAQTGDYMTLQDLGGKSEEGAEQRTKGVLRGAKEELGSGDGSRSDEEGSKRESERSGAKK